MLTDGIGIGFDFEELEGEEHSESGKENDVEATMKDIFVGKTEENLEAKNP